MKSLNSALLNCTNDKAWIEQTKISFGPPSASVRMHSARVPRAALQNFMITAWHFAHCSGSEHRRCVKVASQHTSPEFCFKLSLE
eukprot:2074634-Prymnesium_polylepis.1